MPTKQARKSISKKTRFEVFKRDSFTCQYCGAHPPKAILHVDHIDPVSNGGSNHIDNLITSCDSCNIGKGARLLSDIPKSLKDKSEEIAERELQISGYNEVLMAKMRRIEKESWDIAAALDGKESVETYLRNNLASIRRFLEKLAFAEVLESARIASARFPISNNKQFRYFCGICWAKIREQE